MLAWLSPAKDGKAHDELASAAAAAAPATTDSASIGFLQEAPKPEDEVEKEVKIDAAAKEAPKGRDQEEGPEARGEEGEGGGQDRRCSGGAQGRGQKGVPEARGGGEVHAWASVVEAHAGQARALGKIIRRLINCHIRIAEAESETQRSPASFPCACAVETHPCADADLRWRQWSRRRGRRRPRT
jgi:hypothetical protein